MGVKRSVDFPEDMLNRIKQLAEKMGTTPSNIIKMACKEYLDKNEENKKK